MNQGSTQFSGDYAKYILLTVPPGIELDTVCIVIYSSVIPYKRHVIVNGGPLATITIPI